MRRVLVPLFTAILLLVCAPSPAPAEEPPAAGERLSLADALGGRGWRRVVENWAWRPGHNLLVREVRAGKTRAIHQLDPKTGEDTVLVDLSTLVPGGAPRGGPVRPIGRSQPRTWQFDPTGRYLRVIEKRRIFVHDTRAKTTKLVLAPKDAIQDVKLVPGATHLSYVQGHDLYVVQTDGEGAPVRLTEGGSERLRNASLDWVYPEEFGFDTGHWWAPTGAAVAWLQLDQTAVPTHRLPALLGHRGEGRTMRYPRPGDANPKARLAVTPREGGAPVWLKLGTPEYIVRVAWTPDAARVLVVTMDRRQQRLWLWSADPATGEAQVVLEERSDTWIDAPPAPRFLRARQFLWRTHQSGSTAWQLVTLGEAGDTRESGQSITPDGYEARRVLDVDVASSTCRFLGTKHGSVGQHVFAGWGRVGATAGSARVILALGEAGWTEASFSSDGTSAIVTYSNERTPPRRALVDVASEAVVRPMGDAMTPRTANMAWAVPTRLKIPVADGVIHVRLWEPPDLAAQRAAKPEKTWPVIVRVYGGPGSRVVRDRYGRGPLFETYLTQQGYLVAEIDGRGTGAQSAAFVRSVYKQLGRLELEDQVMAVTTLAKRPYIDGKRVGIWGWSYGGTMAALALVKRSDVFAAGVAVAPVTDWALYDTIYTERYMGLAHENAKGYAGTSISPFVRRLSNPLLLVHGLGDDNVHAQNTVRLVEALLQAKKQPFFDWHLYPRRGHGLGGAHADLYARLMNWFDRSLRPTR